MSFGLKRSETGGGNPAAGLIRQQVNSLFDPVNKSDEDAETMNANVQERPLLSLEMKNEELTNLSANWTSDWNKYYAKISGRAQENEKYWKGEQFGYRNDEYPAIDNVIFESVETLLPLVTRQNPEPIVKGNGTEIAFTVANIINATLVKVADDEILKNKVRHSARHWCIDLLGCVKIAWDGVESTVQFYEVLPENLQLDPTGTFEGGKFLGQWIKEAKEDTAEELIKKFPNKKAEIESKVNNELGTKVKYQECWTNSYVFWQWGSMILDKRRNLNWNWEDEDGNENSKNHLTTPSMPYSFVWHFSLGRQPHDETSLIEQAKPLQDVVNKRTRQIDKNADDTNNGWVFSNQFSQEEAARALAAMRKGGGIVSPLPDIQGAVMRFNAPPLPAYIFQELQDKREQIKNLFGVRGSTASGIVSDRTVQGKIEVRAADMDRVAPIVEQLEQTFDYIFNYTVQMIYVYFTPEILTRYVGEQDAMTFIQAVANENFSLTVSVKEGSTIPESPLTRRNEAIDLFNAGALDPLTLYERLDFPDPEKAAQKLMDYKNPQPPPQTTAI